MKYSRTRTPADIPHLKKTINGYQLIVDGKPFLMRAGELHNSSLSSSDYMDSVWPSMVESNINTCLGCVTWEQVEPEEGLFDFTNLERVIEGARAHNLRLVLLWFGAFKNGLSSYAPQWVKQNHGRFPRVSLRKSDGRLQSADILSLFDNAAGMADAKAFATFMRHLRSIDEDHRTVIMVQVENEVGVLGDSRDVSHQAETRFAQPVPTELVSMLEQKWSKLHPNFRSNLQHFSNREADASSWEDVFGRSAQADEIFMAYHYALYVEEVASAGKSQYPLPLYTNVWQNYADGDGDHDLQTTASGGGQPGDYPSGGAVINVLDIWQHFAPALDFVAPDIYLNNYGRTCAQYRHAGQALFIPEQRRDEYGARRIWVALGSHQALGTAPFGVDTLAPTSNPWMKHYGLMSGVSHHILEAQQRQNGSIGFFFDELGASTLDSNTSIGATFGTWRLTIERAHVFGKAGPGFGMVIWQEDDRFMLIGEGFQVRFASLKPGSIFTGILRFVEKAVGNQADGVLRDRRLLNGDETRSGAVAVMPGEDPDYGDFPISITIAAGTRIAECTVYSLEGTVSLDAAT